MSTYYEGIFEIRKDRLKRIMDIFAENEDYEPDTIYVTKDHVIFDWCQNHFDISDVWRRLMEEADKMEAEFSDGPSDPPYHSFLVCVENNWEERGNCDITSFYYGLGFNEDGEVLYRSYSDFKENYRE